MDDLDLVFQHDPLSGPEYDLVFGDTDTPSVPDVEITLDAQHPPATAAITVGTITDVSLVATHPAPTFTATAKYNSGAQRPLVAEVSTGWQVASPVETGVTHRSSEAIPLPAGVESHWQKADRLAVPVRARQLQGLVKDRTSWRIRHQNAVQAGQIVRSRYGDTLRDRRPDFTSRWQNGIPLRSEQTTRWRELSREQRPQVTSWWGNAVPIEVGVRARSERGIALVVGVQSWWGEAIRPPAGISVIVIPPQPPGEKCYTPPSGDAVDLLFSEAWDESTDLVFVCERTGPPEPGATTVVPVKDVYMISNDIQLLRVSDGMDIPTNSMSLSLDRKSWTWGFQASVPAVLRPQLEPDETGTPQTLAVVINGQPYYMLAELPDQQRSFNSATLSFSGRGINAILSDPYAPVRNFSNASFRTAHQLMEDVLTWNNVPLGWTVDWQAEDWLVPAGVWSFQGNYMAALNEIAQAAGLYLQPHPMDKTIHVLPVYPVAPWKWDTVTPDYELPSDVTVTEGIKWEKKTEYNKVFVTGISEGAIYEVTRDGTAGDLEAQMVVDALLTDEPAGRQLGLSILGNTGMQAQVRLRIPVLSETGVILPGKFVRYVDKGRKRVGIVRSVDVSLGFPEVWQSLEVETHGL